MLKNYIRVAILLCAIAQSFAQTFDKIPASHQNHPEIGKVTPLHSKQLVEYELIHERTAHTRTFLHKNKTTTKAISSVPLHYYDNGFWKSIDYLWHQANTNTWQYPKQNPYIKLNTTSKEIQLLENNTTTQIGKNRKLTFIDANQNVIKTIACNTLSYTQTQNNNTFSYANAIHKVALDYTAGQGFIKSNISLLEPSAIPSTASQLLWEEEIVLSNDQRIKAPLNTPINTFSITKLNDEILHTFHAPVISDAKTYTKKTSLSRSVLQPLYTITALGNNTYKISIFIDANWLNSSERVFPIHLDPVVTITNNQVMNTCFFPNYEQNTINVNVPAGQTVLSSNFEIDFVAVAASDGWISDQRSFISSVSGQTPVLSNGQDNPGTFTYIVSNSEIANGESNGTVPITFNAARTWGGSGCNATFNFISRRYIEINYATLIFGPGNVMVNEYSASNRQMMDGFGNFEDWIELYNQSDVFVNLSGYYLSNDVEVPQKWQIQNGIIPPNGYALVYCSNRNIASGTVLHANFDLTQLRPDSIVLSRPDGTIINSLTMFTTQLNHSYGRTTDAGATFGVLNTPTPNAANVNVRQGYAIRPQITLPAGKYSGSQTINITIASPLQQIRYTLDGSEPTASSTLYTGPFTINQTTVVRARGFSTNPQILPSFIETNTYLINENHILPVFSFAGNANLLQLFNGNQSLTPIGNFEYFDKQGVFVDENLGDFNKNGNDSWNYPQRGVDFVSRDGYGYKRRLQHNFFSTTPRTEFRRLMVKAAANDNYPFSSGGAHIRDPFIQTLSQRSNLDLDERSNTNIVLYVNGQYWGVYNLRERVDDNTYTDHYYGQDEVFNGSNQYIQFLETYGATEAIYGNQTAISDWNSLVNYILNNDMAVPANAQAVDDQLNVDSLIDYFVINSFMVSRDWLNYNTGWWRGLNPAGEAKKWRYILWDQDAGLGHYINFTGMPDVTATAPPCQVEDLDVGNGHAQILKKLITENTNIRQKYVTRYADLLNTHFSCENMITVLDSLANDITPEMTRQIQRWGGGTLQGWQNNVQNVRNFLTTRCASMVNSLATCYNLTGPFATQFNVVPQGAGKIKMNSEWLPNYPFTAQMYGNIESRISAQANSGFVFSHWTVDGAVISPNDTALDITLMLSQATSITANFISPNVGTQDLIYYWHFNTLETPQDVTTILPDYKLLPLENPRLIYTGSGPRDIDAFDTGSDLNLYQNQLAGKAARIRNPSQGRTLVFDLPSTGYKDLVFDYAVQRSGQGMLEHVISYSLDGVSFTQTNLNPTSFTIAENYEIKQLNFSSIAGANNNPNFKVRISFNGNTTATNGNNRIDNIALKGVQMTLSNINQEAIVLQAYPNPTQDILQLVSNQELEEVSIYDFKGAKVKHITLDRTTSAKIDCSDLSGGVYILLAKGNQKQQSIKFVKR